MFANYNAFDSLMARAKASAEKALKEHKAQEKYERTAPSQPKQPEEAYTPLVPHDRLYYCIVSPSTDYVPSRRIDTPSAQAKDAETLFVRTFTEAWTRIPAAERQHMVDYWHRPFMPRLSNEIVPIGHPRPLIQIVDDWANGLFDADYTPFGDVLKFSVREILRAGPELSSRIVRVLAEAYRVATLAHATLLDKMIFGPLDAWESRHPDCSEAAYDKKQDALFKKYDKIHAAQIAEILHRWHAKAP